MNTDELKSHVMTAVEKSWPQFRADHPALAQVIDQEMLGEHLVESLANDAEFKDAYEHAVAARVGAQALSALLARFVGIVLSRLT